MSIFVTSDIHFSHERIMEYCPESRNFSSIEEMNETIVCNWNNTVSENDSVYILGDLFFGKVETAINYINRLNGKLFLVKGNHDHSKKIKHESISSRFEWIRPYYELHHNKRLVVMFHFPIEQWNQRHRGAYHTHGHLHSKNPEKLEHRRYDVGLDGSPNFAPYNLDELLIDIDNRLIAEPTIDHHGREL